MHEELILINRIRNGDHRAFKELYEKNMSALYMFLRQFSADRQTVEDWVQRAFIKAYENISRFDGLSLFRTWLFKIGLNEMRMDFRKAGMKKNIPLQEDIPIEMEDSDFQWNQVMKQWLMELNETRRMIFILYEVEGYSHAEIASLLDIKESTSRTILTRTKAWLKAKWKEEEEMNDRKR